MGIVKKKSFLKFQIHQLNLQYIFEISSLLIEPLQYIVLI